jgi:hypothetical protein
MLMVRHIVATLVFFAAAGAAHAQAIPPISLAPGDAVVVRIDEGGVAAAPERNEARWTRFDLVAARQLAGMTPPKTPMDHDIPIMGTAEARPDPIPNNEVRFRFLTIADRHALLVVENGQDRALAYRARMTVRGETRPTDVCVVLPGLPSYEHWPHTIERIELSDFRFVPWPPGRSATCE